MIQNFERENVKPTSVNIRLSKIFKIKSKGILDLEKKKDYKEIALPYELKPNEYIIGKSVEIFNLPSDVGMLHLHRTTTARAGIMINGGFGDPGYKGEIYFGIKNIGGNKIKLAKKMSLSKVIFITVSGKTVPLITKYLGGKL